MNKLKTVRTAGPWLITDSGANTAGRNMAIDQKALDAMVRGLQRIPVVRFFRWEKPVITYGYLLDRAKVREWSRQNGNLPVVQRPTGGGAVVHQPSDLAISLLWPRKSGLFPDNPRECYAEIHATLRAGVRQYLGDVLPSLYSRPDQACETTPAHGQNRFSVCFDEPVCNDVMLGDRKIVGGALRVTRQAMLYQGAIQLRRAVHIEKLQSCLLSALMDRLAEPAAHLPVQQAGR
jgi:lipoate-protein ligase A